MSKRYAYSCLVSMSVCLLFFIVIYSFCFATACICIQDITDKDPKGQFSRQLVKYFPVAEHQYFFTVQA